MTPVNAQVQSPALEPNLRLWGGVWRALATRTRNNSLPLELVGGRELKLIGSLDKRVARAVKAHAQAFAASDAPSLTIDLSEVTRWDSEGLAALVHALDLADQAGKTLTLVEPSRPLRLILEQSGLHHLFSIVRATELGR